MRETYESLNSVQKRFFDEVKSVLDSRVATDRCNAPGSLFFLQGDSGTGKTYCLYVLRDGGESKGHITLVYPTTGKAASLYQQGRTIHSQLGMLVDEDKGDESTKMYRTTKYGPRSKNSSTAKEDDIDHYR